MEISEEANGNSFIIPGYKDATSYCGTAIRSIGAATKASNALPSDSDFDFYSTFKGFQKYMLSKKKSILSLMTLLLQNHNMKERFQGLQLEEKYDFLEEVNEFLIENISNYMDEASGFKKTEEQLILSVKPQNTIKTSWNKRQFNSSPQSCTLLSTKVITRPQLSFKDKIDNSNAPFIPLIKDKPNSIKPLAIMLEKDCNKEEFCHPYECEIEKFNVPEDVLQEVEPKLPQPLDETPLVYVKTEEQLKKMCKELQQQKEFAVDLEHHSYRSFQGFTCLMQISTREVDYIIDALELRSELHLLNETFTDPKIVKVFHGADMDVVWLQKDFGVYLVNLFDTGQAARLLHYAHLSLSYLLKHYCQLDVDKQFQLADWRIRPLPNELIKYARQDTHYLLYIYDCLKNDLLKSGNETKNLLRCTFERSRTICLKKYEKPIFSEDSYMDLLKKSRKRLNPKQLYCLKELYSWRDRTARENDESLAYVLPNHMLLQIAETLPREQQGVLACCNPIPPLVKQQLNEIHSIVLHARSSDFQFAAFDLNQQAQSTKIKNDIDFRNLNFCNHFKKKTPSSSSSNASTSLPLITKESLDITSSMPPSITAIFEDLPKKNQTASLKKVHDILSNLYTPIQRYEITTDMNLDLLNPESRNKQKSTKRKSSSEKANGVHQTKQKKVAGNKGDMEEDNDMGEDDSMADLNEDNICEDEESSADPCTSTSKKSSPLRKKIVNKTNQSKQKEVCDDDQKVAADQSSSSSSSEDFSSTPLAERIPNVIDQSEQTEVSEASICKDPKSTVDQISSSALPSKNLASTPLRGKSRKKKRKAQPDISLNCTPISQPPPKKSKTPENKATLEANTEFVPYDYSKADLSSFSGKKKSKNTFELITENNFKAPGKHHGRNKKQFKQRTFGNKNKQEKKKWPQNK